MDVKKLLDLQAEKMTPEEFERAKWLMNRYTPRDVENPARRQGKFLHISKTGMFGRSQGQYKPGKRPTPTRRTPQASKSSSRAARARRARKEQLDATQAD